MPGGDGTGPGGMGPMTGRAAGYCAGYPAPGYANPIPGRGFGFGFGAGRGGRPWGGGRGRAWGGGRGWGRGRGRGFRIGSWGFYPHYAPYAPFSSYGFSPYGYFR